MFIKKLFNKYRRTYVWPKQQTYVSGKDARFDLLFYVLLTIIAFAFQNVVMWSTVLLGAAFLLEHDSPFVRINLLAVLIWSSFLWLLLLLPTLSAKWLAALHAKNVLFSATALEQVLFWQSAAERWQLSARLLITAILLFKLSRLFKWRNTMFTPLYDMAFFYHQRFLYLSHPELEAECIDDFAAHNKKDKTAADNSTSDNLPENNSATGNLPTDNSAAKERK